MKFSLRRLRALDRENVRRGKIDPGYPALGASLKCAGNHHCVGPCEPAGVIEGEIAGHDNRAQYRGYFGSYPRSKQTRYLSPRLIHNETAIIRANRETQEFGQWDYGLQRFCAPSFILRIF